MRPESKEPERTFVAPPQNNSLTVIDCCNGGNVSTAKQAAAAMVKTGAVLLRGTGTSDPKGFSELAQLMKAEFPQWQAPALSWDSGNRRTLAPGVTNSASDLPEATITPHCEHQDMPRCPAYVMFACIVPASEGGCTPIYDLERMVHNLEANPIGSQFLKDLRSEGVRASRFYPAESDTRAGPIHHARFPTVTEKFPELEMGVDPAARVRLIESFEVRWHHIRNFFAQLPA